MDWRESARYSSGIIHLAFSSVQDELLIYEETDKYLQSFTSPEYQN